MVCTCKNHCSHEERCTCCGRYCDDLYQLRKFCTRGFFPVCNATHTRDKVEFVPSFQSDIKIPRSYSTGTLLTARDSISKCKAKPKNYESSQDSIISLPSTSHNSEFNERESLISENVQTKLSAQKAPSLSRFGSLKLTLQKMRLRFKKPKNRKNGSYTLLPVERRHESSEESLVETASSEETDSSPSKRIECLNNRIKSYSNDNLLCPSLKAENVSFSSSPIDQNIEETSHAKPLTLTLKAETGAFFKKKRGESTGIFVDANQFSRIQSPSYPERSLNSPQWCSTPLLLNLKLSKVQITGNETLASWSNEKQSGKLPADIKCRTINLKNTENSPSGQFDISYKPTIFKRNCSKYRSTSDGCKSIAKPSFSNFRDESSATLLYSSYPCARSLRTSLDKSNKTKLFKYEINSQVANSEIINEPLNESPEPLISPSRSTYRDNSGTPHHSFSRNSLHCSKSHPSLHNCIHLESRSFSDLSLGERIGVNNSDIQYPNGNDTLRFVCSDLSDNFEALGIRSSPDSTDSESVSSSEFSPCSHCRFVTLTPLISDSVIPYDALE